MLIVHCHVRQFKSHYANYQRRQINFLGSLMFAIFPPIHTYIKQRFCVRAYRVLRDTRR